MILYLIEAVVCIYIKCKISELLYLDVVDINNKKINNSEFLFFKNV